MKLISSMLGLATLTLFASNASSGVYKCTDEQGKTAYQSSPCSEEKKALKIDIKSGGLTDLSIKLKQQEQQQALKKQQEIERQKQLAIEAKRIQDAKEQSAINQQLIKDNPIQYTAFAIPPYRHDRLTDLVKPFASRLPEIEEFRRLAAQKALSTGECKRVESDQLSIQSQLNTLVFTVDCSSAKTFLYTESDLVKK